MATSGSQYFTANTFEITSEGVPAAGYQLFFYESGTSTPQDVYADPGLTTPLANPVVADANGRFGAIWLSPSPAYKVQLFTAATDDDPTGSEVWSEDPIGPGAGGAVADNAGIIGEVRAFAGPSSSVPSGWYLCYGQAISRTTYAALFSVIGTTWGSGDGSTTFNLPDLRGRAMFGKDDMGGSAANRVTGGVSGVAGTTLGGTGGDQHAQEDTLTSTSIVTDPGHLHVEVLPVYGNVASGGSITVAGPPTTNTSSNTQTATTGITVATNTSSGLSGASQNMPPTAIVNWILYAGV